MVAAEQTQQEVDQSLDHIEDNQRQLLQVLDEYDQKIINVLDGQGDSRNLNSTPADAERDRKFVIDPFKPSATTYVIIIATPWPPHSMDN